MAKPTPEQLGKINRFTKTPVGEDDVHVHSFRLIGTSLIPSRHLQFDRSLFDKYLTNIENGDVVQIADHSFGRRGFLSPSGIITLPFGRFFEGEVVADGDKYQLDGTMFMPKGVKTYISDFTTDDISQQIDAGILHDSSVSVTWGFSECSICHNDIRDYEKCSHWPGRSYDVNGKQVQCFVIAKPKPQNDTSMMIENSIVCAGAYPDAGVLLAKHPNQPLSLNEKQTLNGIADLKLVDKDAPVFCCLSSTSATFLVEGEAERDPIELDQLYHLMYQEKELPEGWTRAKLVQKHKENVKAILDVGHVHFLRDALDGTLPNTLKAKSVKGSENVDEKERQTFQEQIDALTKEKIELEKQVDSGNAEIANLKAKIDELTALAKLGEKYREDVIASALASGVRAEGNDFAEDTFKKMFASLEIDEIKAMGEKWEAKALAKLGVIQHTEGQELNLPSEAIAPKSDPRLYKV